MEKINRFLLFFVLLVSFGLFACVGTVNAATNIYITWNYPSNATTNSAYIGSGKMSLLYNATFMITGVPNQWKIPISLPVGVSGAIELMLEYPQEQWGGVGSNWQRIYNRIDVGPETRDIDLTGMITFIQCGNQIEDVYAKVYYDVIYDSCGPANGVPVASAPTSGLCLPGSTAYDFSGTGPWEWKCRKVFSDVSYTVTYDSQSATVPASPTIQTVVAGKTVENLPTNPTKTNYSFNGWYTAPNGGGSLFNASTSVYSNITVYAKWSAPITALWSGIYSSGDTECARKGATCSKAYKNEDGANIGCADNRFTAGNAQCFSGTTTRRTWSGFSSGNATCAKYGGVCLEAYNSSGVNIACDNTGYVSGRAFCSGTVASWSNVYSSGDAECARKGATCSKAYKNEDGANIGCADNRFTAGNVLCFDPIGEYASWSNIYSSGDAECTFVPATCLKAFSTDGITVNSRSDCSDNKYPNGFALCSEVSGGYVTWSSPSSGDATCALFGKTCLKAYYNNGTTINSILCSNKDQSNGRARCSDTLGTPVTWSIISSGDAECNKRGAAKCLKAYKSDGTGIDCADSYSIGNALCSNTIGTQVTWSSASSGDATCAKFGAACLAAYKSDGTSIDCADIKSAVGSAWCSDKVGVPVSWSYTYFSGDVTCANSGLSCSKAYKSDGTDIDCADSYSIGNALCSNTVTVQGNNIPVCTAPLLPAVDGDCGSANGVGVTSAPSANLCSAGTASAVSGTGPWTWTCAGINGGVASPTCLAPLVVNGVCGSSNNVTYPYTGTISPSPFSGTQLCSSGVIPNAQTLPAEGGSSISWTCAGQNGGTPDSCSAHRGGDTSASPSCTVAGPDNVSQGGNASFTVNYYNMGGTSAPVFISGYPKCGDGATASGVSCSGGDSGTCNFTCNNYSVGIYALSGYNSTYFYRYSVASNSWTQKAYTPRSISSGGALVYPGSGDYLYALRGGSSKSFYRYSISNDQWATKANAPGYISSGGALVYYPDSGGYIYALNGGSSSSFYRYSISTDQWVAKRSTPGSIYAGGALVYPGSGDYLYALRGGNSTSFYSYSISNDQWATKASTPGSIFSGGALVYYPDSDDYIYALAGGNSKNFYRYSILNDQWSSMNSVPVSIYDGASLSYPGSGDDIYALTGGAPTFYRYSISGNSWTKMTSQMYSVSYGSSSASDYSLSGTSYKVFSWLQNSNYSINCNKTISIISSPPQANLNDIVEDYCSIIPGDTAGGGGSLSFSWAYNDPNSLSESRYQLQIDNDSDFSSPIVDVNATGLSNPSGTVNTPAQIIVSRNPTSGKLAFNTTYYWRAQVYNSNNVASGWVNGGSFSTPTHSYPHPYFEASPVSATLVAGKAKIDFNDGSMCYSPTDNTEQNCNTAFRRYYWNFDENGATCSDSSCQGSTSYAYTIKGTHNPSLQICDTYAENYCCQAGATVQIKSSLGVPNWQEVSPF